MNIIFMCGWQRYELSINNMLKFRQSLSVRQLLLYCSCVAIVIGVRVLRIQWASIDATTRGRKNIHTQMWLCIAYFIVQVIRHKCH